MNAKAVPIKSETDIILGYSLPEGFNPDTWTLELYAWGESEKCDVPAVDGEFGVRSCFEGLGGAVEWIGEHRVVAGMLNNKTAVLQIANKNVFVDGERFEFDFAPYISEQGSTQVWATLLDLMR